MLSATLQEERLPRTQVSGVYVSTTVNIHKGMCRTKCQPIYIVVMVVQACNQKIAEVYGYTTKETLIENVRFKKDADKVVISTTDPSQWKISENKVWLQMYIHSNFIVFPKCIQYNGAVYLKRKLTYPHHV